MNGELESFVRKTLKEVLLEVAQEVMVGHFGQTAKGSRDDVHDGPLLLRPKDAANTLAISERTLHSLTQAGKIPSVRIGRLVRYSRQSLGNWIECSAAAGGTVGAVVKSQQRDVREREHKPNATGCKSPKGRRKRQSNQASGKRESRRMAHVPQPNGTDLSPTSNNMPRSVYGFFSSRLGVDENALPRLTNGEIMRIAGVDIPTLHGWVYHNRDMPESAIKRLEEFFTSRLRASMES